MLLLFLFFCVIYYRTLEIVNTLILLVIQEYYSTSFGNSVITWHFTCFFGGVI